MAQIGLRLRNSETGTDVAKAYLDALMGDPKEEAYLARTRSAIDTDAAERRRIQEQTSLLTQQTLAQAKENETRHRSGPVLGDIIYDAVNQPDTEAPAVVEPGPVPNPVPLDMFSEPEAPAIVAEPMPAPEEAFSPASTMFNSGADIPGFRAVPPMPIPQGGTPTHPLQPSEPPVVVDLGEEGGIKYPAQAITPAAGETVTPLDQPDVLPGEIRQEADGGATVGTERGSVRLTREEAEALGFQAAYSTDSAGQAGKLAGLVGTVYGDPNDPVQQARNNLLYANKTAGETAGADSDLVRNLRKDFAATPAFQKWEIVNNGYQNMRGAMDTLAQMRSEDDPVRGPADMRLIYSYLKLLDPNTGIKENEYATAEEAGGKVAPYLNLWNSVVAGDRLDPRTRTAFLREGKGMYDTATKDLDPLIKQYTGEAKEFDIEPSRIIRDMPSYETWKPPPMTPREGVTPDMIQRKIKDALPDVITPDEAIMLLNAEQAGGRS